jgi:hypothetical protein
MCVANLQGQNYFQFHLDTLLKVNSPSISFHQETDDYSKILQHRVSKIESLFQNFGLDNNMEEILRSGRNEVEVYTYPNDTTIEISRTIDGVDFATGCFYTSVTVILDRYGRILSKKEYTEGGNCNHEFIETINEYKPGNNLKTLVVIKDESEVRSELKTEYDDNDRIVRVELTIENSLALETYDYPNNNTIIYRRYQNGEFQSGALTTIDRDQDYITVKVARVGKFGDLESVSIRRLSIDSGRLDRTEYEYDTKLKFKEKNVYTFNDKGLLLRRARYSDEDCQKFLGGQTFKYNSQNAIIEYLQFDVLDGLPFSERQFDYDKNGFQTERVQYESYLRVRDLSRKRAISY